MAIIEFYIFGRARLVDFTESNHGLHGFIFIFSPPIHWRVIYWRVNQDRTPQSLGLSIYAIRFTLHERRMRLKDQKS